MYRSIAFKVANSGMETAMSRKMLTGSFVALITPFNKDGSVDFDAFRRPC